MNYIDKSETIVEGPLYASSKKVYPQAVKGPFRNIKWTFMALALSVYYFLPFVRWDRGPGLPNQAVLIDLPHRRFYFFFIELWPQEVYYFTGLLIIAAFTLFLMNAVAGRIWCGFMCPQTVWTDLFYAVERMVEGDRRDRMRKDKQKLTPRRVWEIATKHTLWLMIAWWTGGAWVLYFDDAPRLVHDLATFQGPISAYVWIGILTLTTYFLAGHMREQVCVYMCPWPRIQAALTDEWALNVTYRGDRGEPRISAKKAVALRAKGEKAGDCVDCRQCIAVCPTGVDIRDGSQLGCIQCGLCIDACNHVMVELGRPKGLIAYDNDMNHDRRAAGQPEVYKLIRARTVLYVVLIAGVGGLMAYALVNRSWTGVNVLHDRNPLAVLLSDGTVRNGYTARLLNKHGVATTFDISVTGLEDARLVVVGESAAADGSSSIEVGPDQTLETRLLVTAPAKMAPDHAIDVEFHAVDRATGEKAVTRDHFFPK